MNEWRKKIFCHRCGVTFTLDNAPPPIIGIKPFTQKENIESSSVKYKVIIVFDAGKDKENALRAVERIKEQKIRHFAMSLIQKDINFIMKNNLEFAEAKAIIEELNRDFINYPELAEAGIYGIIEPIC
ncbi:MAG: hypothetical protein G8237_09660 [Magnetococcales bacterium]|nr:hypothetical protein [Magnetococcales bacterium]NGZ06611.1 hypothetical protein [Magnetococcales bacterium]